MAKNITPLFDRKTITEAVIVSFCRLTPQTQIRNPVMFTVYIVSILSVIICLQNFVGTPDAPPWFSISISVFLWLTVLFANFAEAIAEGKGRAQAESLKNSRQDILAKKLTSSSRNSAQNQVKASLLRKNDHVLVEVGDLIPGDGEVIEGIASVDESAITGESAPVIREAGGDRSSVTGGTKVLSDWLVIRIGAEPGEGFLDKMISMVESAKRQRTPNEIALSILLSSLTIIFVLVCASLRPFSAYSVSASGSGTVISITCLIALLVCLAPTTIGALLSAIGIAGIDRLIRKNIIAMSGRAVEAAGDIDVLLLDKTGTITLGNRQAAEFYPAKGIDAAYLAQAAQLSSLTDETPEGRSIVVLAKQKYNIREQEFTSHQAEFIPFTAQTRMSGIDISGRQIRKGAPDTIQKLVQSAGNEWSSELQQSIVTVAHRGATPLVVAENGSALGVIELRDIVKGGIKERFSELRRMGIKTIMITGDNPVTAAAIAAEAGVDDFLAEATPENKLRLIRDYQAGGRLVAMTGDGTNDAPALAQADVAVAMNSGTQAAKEAGNMIDLDSDPTKLIEIVETGKQLLMTRGALTTFSIANDVAKYFAIIPAAFVTTYPQLEALDIMHLYSPESAILSAVIFNALIIVALIPIALKGVTYQALGATAVLRRNVLIYGVGGLVVPFIGIKIIDLVLSTILER